MSAWLILADYAQVHAGKLFINGGGINLVGPGQINMGVAAAAEIPYTDRSRRQRFRIALFNQDGQPFIINTPVGSSPLEVQGEFESVPAPGSPAGNPLTWVFAFNIAGMSMSGGTYEWRLHLGDEERPTAVSIFAVRTAPSPPTLQPPTP